MRKAPKRPGKDSALLSIRGLRAGYGEFSILNKVSLDVAKGEIVAIVGPNGAGKSTLLKGILGLSQVYEGGIVFNGKSIVGAKTHELMRLGINFVPQGRNIFENMTVRENLEMGDFIQGDGRLVQEKIEEIMQRFPALNEKQNAFASELSGGQRQLLALAKALMSKPELLLLDEPSLGLDPKTIKQLFHEIQEINSGGTTIVIVEQNARQAIRIADKTIVLENGSVALQGGKEIIRNPMIKSIYLGGQ